PTRRPRRRRRSPLSYLPLPFVGVAAALVVFVAVGTVLLPQDRNQLTGLSATNVAVTAARVVCPASGGTHVAAMAPGSGKGSATLRPLDSTSGATLGALGSAPSRGAASVNGSVGATAMDAEGPMAPGFEVEQYARSDSGGARGIQDVRCVTPAAQWWFAGAATTIGNDSRLYLNNLDNTTATVDVLAYGDGGAVDPEAGSGVTVDPGKQAVVKLGDIAPEMKVSAVHVVARTGRIAAALHTQVRSGSTSYGAAWIPPTQPRSGDTVIPAVPSGSGPRKLVLFVPGDQDTTASVRLSTPDGSFAPAGHDQVDVPAQQAVAIDLGNVMAKSATAVQVNAPVPVVAALVASEGGSGEDGSMAFSTGTPSLDSPAGVPMVPTGSKTQATLQLTSPQRDAQVQVRTVARTTVGRPSTVKIPAGRTVAVKLSPPGGAPDYGVLVTPQQGADVYGSRVIVGSPKGGPVIGVYPLEPGVREVALPPVVPEMGAGIPR
ncbi:MAG: hypothetical protein J2P14_08030, partial [Acidothermales bacterium]|nr:hypothetical protein [Acidothermales bacterium]